MGNTAAVDVPSPTLQQIPKKEKYLIAFNKFKKITFFGACKIEINKTDKCLIFRTNAVEKRFQEFASTFNRIFVQKENALCILDAISNKDFIVIFPLKSTCDRIMEEINKVKFPSGPPTSDSATDDHLFKTNFYIPILKGIQSKITRYNEIQTVLLDLVNKFEPDQRQTYMNMVFEILLSSTNNSVNNAIINSDITVAVDNETSVMNDETFDNSFSSTDNQSLNETPTSSNYSFRKRPAIYYSSSNSSIHESNLDSTATKKTRKSSADNKNHKKFLSSNIKMKIIKLPGFKVLQHKWGDKFFPKLYVFDRTDRTLCYEYTIQDKTKNKFRCYECKKFDHYVYAKLIQNGEGAEDSVALGSNEHLCKPKMFINDVSETRIIQKPNFQIEMVPKKADQKKSVKTLTICDPAYGNQKFLYYFHQQHKSFYCKNCHRNGKYVSAKLVKDENGEECIELSAVKHVCL